MKPSGFFPADTVSRWIWLALLAVCSSCGPAASVSAEVRSKERIAWVSAVRVLPSGEKLVVGRNDGTIEMWSIRQRSLLWHSQGADGQVLALWLSKDQKRVKAVQEFGVIQGIELATGKTFAKRSITNQLRGDFLRDAAISPDGKFLIVADGKKYVAPVFDISELDSHQPQKIGELGTPGQFGENWVTSVCFCEQTGRVVMTTRKGYVLVWSKAVWSGGEKDNSRTGKNRLGFVGVKSAEHVRRMGRELDWTYTILRGAACADGVIATVGVRSSNGSIQLWNGNDMRLLDKHIPRRVFDPHPPDPCHAHLDGAGRILVTTGWIWHWVWRIGDSKLTPIGSVAVSSGGAVSSRDFPEAVDFLQDKIVIGRGADVFIVDPETLRAVSQLGTGPSLRSGLVK